MQPLFILNSGMITGVGLNAAASCAAIRCGINSFRETRFMDKGGEWIIGSEVTLDQPWRGKEKLVRLVVPAIRECLEGIDESTGKIPLFLCVAESNRPGRLQGLEEGLMERVQAELSARFHEKSAVIAQGRVGGVVAMDAGRKLMEAEGLRYFLIAGVDTLLTGQTLAAYEEDERLLTSRNSNGFIPGEAGAAVLIGVSPGETGIQCTGIGFGHEKATVLSEEPSRADGLVEAIRAALADAKASMGDVDYRITDLSGEQYGFREASLALSRICRVRKDRFDIWHPADCVGEVGAAALPVMLGVALAAGRKGYAPGNGALCHTGNDDGERAAMVLQHYPEGTS